MISRANFWLLFGGLWLAVGALFAVIGAGNLWRNATLDERLARDGVRVSGQVLAKSLRSGQNRETTFHAEYRYTAADGRVTERTAEVDGKTWDALVEGEAIALTYVRDAPDQHRLAGQSGAQQALGLIFAGVGTLFAAAGALILWHFFARRRLEERLQRDGLRASAEVLEVLPTNFRVNRQPQWAIRYQYRDRLGATHLGRTPPMPQEAARRWNAGDRGEVRFDVDQPQRSLWIDKD